MPVHLHLPGALRPYAGGSSRLELSAGGATVAELLKTLGGAYPGVHQRVVDELGGLRPHVNVFVNGENIRYLSGLATSLNEGDEVWLLPAVSGGSGGFGDHRVAQDADALDLDLDPIADGQWANALRCAGEQHVAGQQRHHRRDEGDQAGDPPLQP
jgi:molybdopterin synthase sulfur carrier subunit